MNSRTSFPETIDSVDLHRTWGTPARAVLVAGFVLCTAIARAQVPDSIDPQTAPAIAAPLNIDASVAPDAYAPPSTFNGGHYYVDHFAGPTNADEVGLVTAQMSNGDIVVAGLVPDFGSGGTCSNGTALCNVGLVRYSQAGVRQAWTNAGSYGHSGNQYIVYPGGGSAPYEYIRDIKVANGTIYVMVDSINTSRSGLGRQDVQIVQFHEDGSYINAGVFGLYVFGKTGLTDAEDFYGAQMAFTSDNKLMAVATAYDANGAFVAVNRLFAASDLIQDTSWGTPYSNGGNYLIRYHGNVNTTAGYAVTPIASTAHVLYIAGSADNPDSDVYVRKLSTDTGDGVAGFGNGGIVVIGFDQPFGSHDDYAGGLYVYQDEVYLAAQVDQKCRAGIGMARINGATGALATAFGGTGKIVFGGEGNVPTCASVQSTDVPLAISATGGRIGVVGYNHTVIQPGFNQYNPMLAVVNAVTGGILDLNAHPVTRADGSRAGDAVLYGVFGGPNPDSAFTVAGNGRDAASGNSLSYITGQFVPLPDLIFANAFECVVCLGEFDWHGER